MAGTADMTDYTGTTILLVEDNAIIALRERKTLEGEGYTVKTVHTGEDAVAFATAPSVPVGLILMDIDLGTGITGTEAARQIRARRDLPVVFLTSHAEQEVVTAAQQITRYGYVLKNTGEFMLLQSVKTALELFAEHRRVENERVRFQSLFNTAPTLAIQGYAPDGTVLYWNRASEELYGYSAAEAIGGNLVDLIIPPEMSDEVQRLIRHSAETGEPIPSETLLLRRKDGSPVEVYSRHTVVQYPDRPTEVFCLDADMSRHRESEQLLRRILDSLPVPVVVSSGPEERVQSVNRAFLNTFGYSAQEVGDLAGWFHLAYPDPVYRAEIASRWTAARDAAGPHGLVGPMEADVTCCDGTVRNVDVLAHSIDDIIVVTFTDYTAVRTAQRQLEESLREKDWLMQELNHRTKNNLMLVSALVGMKDERLGDAADLSDIRSRIDAIGLIHETLYAADAVMTIDFNAYLDTLLPSVFSFYPHSSVTVEIRIDHAVLPTRTAVTLGIIVNELATNAMKHAFLPGEPAHFSVELAGREEGSHRELTVSNSGRPIPETVDVHQAEGLGLRLIGALVQQLGGTMGMERTPKTAFRICFP
jgi:PAS domain S-box-containing protein